MKITGEGKSEEKLLGDHLLEMRRFVREDPTFASFFAENVRFAPESLTSILINSRLLSVIQQDILPPWKERAKFLISP